MEFATVRKIGNRRQRKYSTTNPGKLKRFPNTTFYYTMHYHPTDADELAHRQVAITFYEHKEVRPDTRMVRAHGIFPESWRHRKYFFPHMIETLRRDIKKGSVRQ